jgi:hypothetical protein
VREVWYWIEDRLSVYVLEGGAYVERSSSAVLPGLDLRLLESFLDRESTSRAIREYRAALRR